MTSASRSPIRTHRWFGRVGMCRLPDQSRSPEAVIEAARWSPVCQQPAAGVQAFGQICWVNCSIKLGADAQAQPPGDALISAKRGRIPKQGLPFAAWRTL